MVTVRINSTLKQYNFITGLMQEVTNMMYKNGMLNGVNMNRSNNSEANLKEVKNSFPFDIVMLKVPKNFIRKLVGYQEKTLTSYRKNFAVDFYFDRDLLTDDVFYMNETAQLRIFGRNQDVISVNELIQNELEQIKMKTILMQMNDCKIIMDNVKEVKVMVDPCEIRVKKMTREWKDLRHPFYYLPNYFREMVLIGTEKEIQFAENQIDLFFQTRRDNSNIQQISFLLPIYFKNLSSDIKNSIYHRCPLVQIFFYEPTFPRKHLTVLLIGPWASLLLSKQILEDQANIYMQRNSQNFDVFQQFTYHQQIRFSFKSLKRFVLEQDIKYLNHWDLCSIFVEDAGKQDQFMEWHKLLTIGPPNQQNIEHSSLTLMPDQLTTLSQRSVSQQYASRPYFNQPSVPSISNIPPLSVALKHDKDYQALVDFLKNQDVETCINSLFVLMDSQKAEESLHSMLERLQISKHELIQNMNIVLQKNINDYEDSIGYFQRGPYEPMKIIDQTGENRLVIEQSRSVRDYQNRAAVNKSRSPSHRNQGYNHSNYSSYHHGHDPYSYKRDYDYNVSTVKHYEPCDIKQFEYDQVLEHPTGELNRSRVRDHQSRSRSQSNSRSRPRDYSSGSSKDSRSHSNSKRSYQGWRSSRRHQESPDFTRPLQDSRAHHYSSRYYERSSPSRHSYYHSYSRPPNSHRSSRDDYKDYKSSGYSHGHHHRQRSRSKHRRSGHHHHHHHRRSESEDSGSYRKRSRRHHHHHHRRERDSSREHQHRSRHLHHYKSRSRSRSRESHRRTSRSQYERRESKGRSRSPQRSELINRYNDHPYFSGHHPNSIEITFLPNSYIERPKQRRGFDFRGEMANQMKQHEPNVNEEGQL